MTNRQQIVRLQIVAALTATIFAFGCTPVTTRLRNAATAGRHDEVVTAGRAWLADEGRGATGDKARTAVEVAHLVAAAELERARLRGDVEALRTVRATYAGRAGFEELVARAVAAGAELELREEIEPHPTVDALRTFRARYPGTPQEARARHLEVAVAAESARSRAAPEAERRFRSEYEGWPESAAAVAASRAREVELAERLVPPTVAGERRFRGEYGGWREAEAAFARSRVREVALAASASRGSPEALAAFLAAYAAWPEAEDARASAREEATALALEAAGLDLQRLRAFRAEHRGEPWAARGDAAFAQALLAAIRGAVEDGRAPDVDVLEEVLAPDAPLTALRSAAVALEASLWDAADGAREPTAFLAYAALFPGSARAAEASARARAAAWQRARDHGTPEAFRAIVARFPGSDEAEQAERLALALEERDRPSPGSPRAAVTATRRLGSGEVELTVDVVRCGGRVAGLRRDAFALDVNGRSQSVTGFLSLEEDRPLQIVFVIDLSGSMAVEREAVRRAVQQFAETFRFRGREVSLGLVSFSDGLRDRKAPTPRPEEFRAWLEAIGDARGGAMEDSAGGLRAAADLLARADGERVLVLLTDEPLQAGAGPVLAAARSARACDRVFRLLREHRGCGAARCRLRAVRQLDPALGGVVDACVRRFGMAACDRELDESVFGAAFGVCAGGVGSEVVTDSPAFVALRGHLARHGVRPFLILPHALAARGALADLATALDGRVAAVDDDAADVAAFADPLLVIADQLSKQYVIRYRPDPGAAAPPRVTVRLDHDFGAWGESAHAVSLASLGGAAPGCPELAALTREGALYRSRDCARRFERWTIPGVDAAQAMAPGRSGALLVLAEGRVVAVEADGAASGVATRLARASGIQLGWDGTVWLTGVDERGAPALARGDEAGFERFRLDLGGAPGVVLPGGATGPTCAIVPPDVRVCGDGHAASTRSTVAGLAPHLLAAGAGEVLAVPGRAGTFLWATPGGAVLRTTDSGGHFREALPPTGEPRRLTLVPAARPLVCAASAREIRCSDDLGLTWFAAGADREESAATVAVGAAGGQLFLDRGERLERLTRVINRDAPSSAVYFETGRAEPRAAIHPFLVTLGRTLAAAPALALRVEGHADRRGEDALNDELARARATRIAAAVIAAGARPEQLEVASHGSRRPIRAGSSPDDLARNRRVELVLLEPLALAPATGDGAARGCPDEADLAPAGAALDSDEAASAGEEPDWDAAPDEDAELSEQGDEPVGDDG